jgi:hypothetical protein
MTDKAVIPIIDMITKMGGHRGTIANRAGISVQGLNNQVYKKVKVALLTDGRYVTIRNDATYFEVEE